MIMLSIAAATDEEDSIAPGLSLERRSSSSCCSLPQLLIINSLSSKRIHSYSKLHQEPLKLTVRKLDGSSFDIEVTKTATVLDLKQAVEDVFTHLEENGKLEISWPHVWGHFCLCYDDQKLITENDRIKYYGIKDGDQLQFIRHQTVNYNFIKKRSLKRLAKRVSISLSRSDSNEEFEPNGDEEENYDDQEIIDHEKDLVGLEEPQTPPFLNNWFSYSKHSPDNTHSSKETGGFCNGFKSLMRLYSDKHFQRKDAWRDD